MKLATLSLISAAALSLLIGTPAAAQGRLTDSQLLNSLQTLDEAKSIDVAALRQKAIDSVAQNRSPDPNNREPLDMELDDLSQLTVEIQFQLNSAAILPASFRTLGVIADSLHYPTMLEYAFLVVGHTDASGGRKRNLELSQKRADAVRDALITTFGISPQRVFAVGLGEEQLLDRRRPDSPKNRRVQLINIGRFQ
jgi:OmpA-OmpF porin, OOP family